MPLKKSELYSSLWSSCDELRGGMDASQYKDYVLVLLFVKYVSDKAASQKGFLLNVPKGGRFEDMVAAEGQQGNRRPHQQDHRPTGRRQRQLKGAINVADFNDKEKLGKGHAMVQRLTKLVSIFEGLISGATGPKATICWVMPTST
jgi:type I restriction enzyme M protein